MKFNKAIEVVEATRRKSEAYNLLKIRKLERTRARAKIRVGLREIPSLKKEIQELKNENEILRKKMRKHFKMNVKLQTEFLRKDLKKKYDIVTE